MVISLCWISPDFPENIFFLLFDQLFAMLGDESDPAVLRQKLLLMEKEKRHKGTCWICPKASLMHALIEHQCGVLEQALARQKQDFQRTQREAEQLQRKASCSIGIHY
jgi:hypothetical protein